MMAPLAYLHHDITKARSKHRFGLVRLLYLEVKSVYSPNGGRCSLGEVKRPRRQINESPCEGAKEVKDK